MYQHSVHEFNVHIPMSLLFQMEHFIFSNKELMQSKKKYGRNDILR